MKVPFYVQFAVSLTAFIAWLWVCASVIHFVLPPNFIDQWYGVPCVITALVVGTACYCVPLFVFEVTS